MKRPLLLVVLCVAFVVLTAAEAQASPDFATWMLGIVAVLAAGGIVAMVRLAIEVKGIAVVVEHLKDEMSSTKLEMRDGLRDAKAERDELRRRVSGMTQHTPIHGTVIPQHIRGGQ